MGQAKEASEAIAGQDRRHHQRDDRQQHARAGRPQGHGAHRRAQQDHRHLQQDLGGETDAPVDLRSRRPDQADQGAEQDGQGHAFDPGLAQPAPLGLLHQDRGQGHGDGCDQAQERGRGRRRMATDGEGRAEQGHGGDHRASAQNDPTDSFCTFDRFTR